MSETLLDKMIEDESKLIFTKWGFIFEGAFSKSNYLKPKPGVYAIWCRSGVIWTLLDVGETENIKERIVDHEHALIWLRSCSELSGKLYYSASYMPGSTKAKRSGCVDTIKTATPPICE